jgi:fatty acid CoA ligase FadD32
MTSDLIRLLDVRVAECDAQPAFTFVDYSVNRAGAELTLTWRELDQRACALAVLLVDRVGAGGRAAIVAPNGIDYVVAFFGCLRAGVIAVPVHGLSQPGHTHRLASVIEDCHPEVLLTTTAEIGDVEGFLKGGGTSYIPGVIAVDLIDPRLADSWAPPAALPEHVAYLQYTSGSTSAPSGVMITHANVVANLNQVAAVHSINRTMTSVSWLPLFHDMGLAMTMGTAVVLGCRAVFTTPFSFIHHPSRWLWLLSTPERSFGAAPDFAFEYCSKRCSVSELEGLDLSGVSFILNGAEPIKAGTLETFVSRFAEHGLAAEAVRPSYGLAEATVFVTSSPRPLTTTVESGALTQGIARETDNDAPQSRRFVACGPAGAGTAVRVVDVSSHGVMPAGSIGEIWVSSSSVGKGYWGKPEDDQDVFGAVLTDPPPGTAAFPWLRTGDLGFVHGGQLYVTGRLKDLIILDGANHHPSDIEHTVEDTHPTFRRGRVAAFGVSHHDREQVVIIAEFDVARIAAGEDFESIVRLVRRRVTAEHSLRVHEFIPVRSGTVPTTSSGKVQRSLCRQHYESGELAVRVVA